ncbi:iron complex outermembrane recepter protein [Flavobacterium fontis]|uniref:Iron complex outermembrane recepter protein n=1 Tax=Flavobacterium fontis TaxID=1124188 RepID=A0A1M4YSD4_9FLAO|nr:TonB-dependent receptor [Flavobacterium fontis]SHF08618.1 iron complex outermembrane recepter protein [Flavobacterium fontis]
MENSYVKSLKASVVLTLFLGPLWLSAQQKSNDSTQVNQLDEVLVKAVRVNKKTPVTFSNLTQKDIASRNLGQDIPILMNYMPSVVTTSDAGNGFGYTGIRVRGTDATRVNVTINGIPYNDSESHGTFWVNMPDFASSVQSMQLQRGVGTSTNGAGAFGASLNLLTDSYSKKGTGEIANSFGSFNARKHTVKFSTGLMNDRFEIAGRLSQIASDGYVDRASADLKSYFLQGTYVGKTTLIKGLVFGGRERTYQSWNGIDGPTLAVDRTFNSAGIFTDEFGNTRFYDNETDNYQQDHAQLHWSERWNDRWSTNVALHYTKGKGYFENYKEDADFAEYGLAPVAGQTSTDLIRQKWLDNDFYGTTFSANYKKDEFDLILGGGWNKYEGLHFGRVIWARFASTSELGDEYYNDYGIKTDGNVFAKATYDLSSQWSVYGDVQYRRVNYKANGVQPTLVDDTFNFFNPKVGVNYAVNTKNILYFSYARANREPNRTDYEGGNVRPEKLNDFELGWRYEASKVQFNANVYYMLYRDQLILTGALDDVGSPVRSNSERSYRLGLEVDATIALSKQWIWKPNFTISQNQNIDLTNNGVAVGNTAIAYSPNLIAGNLLLFEPVKNLHLTWLSKFVGEQFMNNLERPEARLPDYFVNDFNVSYSWNPKSVFRTITVNGLVNNILDKTYVSNGYMWDIFPYYYPQAGRNFLVGLTLQF